MRAGVIGCASLLCSLAACGGTSSKAPNPSGSEVPGLPACKPLARVGVGGTTGNLLLSGHVRDSSGRPIVDAEVRLGGRENAVRYTNFFGAYTFSLNPASYDIRAGGGCALEPAVVNEQSLEADTIQNFVAAGAGCIGVEASNGGRFLVLEGLSRTIVSIREAASHDAAVQELDAIANELPDTEACTVSVDGQAAIERVAMISGEGPLGGPPVTTVAVTTGIAFDTTVVRFESSLAATATTEQIDVVLAAGRNFSREDLRELNAK